MRPGAFAYRLEPAYKKPEFLARIPYDRGSGATRLVRHGYPEYAHGLMSSRSAAPSSVLLGEDISVRPYLLVIAMSHAPHNPGAVFAGRAEQLNTLTEYAGDSRSGSPCVVVLEGSSGIGKTALVRRAAARLADFTVLWASCGSAEQDLPFGVVEQLARCAGTASTGGPRPPADAALHPAAPPAVIGRQLLGLLASLGRTGPVLLVLDDLQWADIASVHALNFVLRRLTSERILLVVTIRAADHRAALWTLAAGEDAVARVTAGAERVRRMRLAGLTLDEVAQLIEAIYGRASSRQAAARLWQRTGGHPLYLAAVLAEARRGGPAARDLALSVPNSLAAAIQRTITRLPAQAGELLEALAVLNTRVPLAAVAKMTDLTDPAAAVESALTADLLHWWPDHPSTPVQLTLPLQRDAIYYGLAPVRRRKLHAAAVPLVDADSAWSHRVAAADQLDPGLAAELEAEAGQMLRAGRPDRAGRLLLWAADLSGERGDFERRLLFGAARLKRQADIAKLKERVQGCAPSALRSCVLGRIAIARAEFGLAEYHLRAAIAEADRDEQVTALARTALTGVYLWQERTSKAAACARRVLALPAAEPGAIAFAQFSLVVRAIFVSGLTGGEQALAQYGAHPGTPAANLVQDRLLLLSRGLIRGLSGQFRAGCEDLTTAIASTDRSEIEIGAHLSLAIFRYLAGAWDDATDSAENAMVIAGSDELSWGVAASYSIAALIAGSRGNAVASNYLEVADRASHKIGLPADTLFPALVRALLAEARGDADRMLDLLAPLLALPATGQRLLWRSLWLPVHASALIAAKQLEEAGVVLADLHDLACRCPQLRLVTARLDGQLARARGDSAAAGTAFHTGLTGPAGSDDVPLHRAQLEHAYGRLLLADRNRRAATALLWSAHERYLALGAVSYLEQLAGDLEAAGIRATRHPAGPIDRLASLTERERLIAGHAARGLPNQEIAAKLYLSVKTVEYHLGHAYTKLGITSRRQLRDLLHGLDGAPGTACRRPGRAAGGAR